MRIRKFYESDSIEISNDRVSEIIEELSTISSDIDSKKQEMKLLTDELSNFRSKSNKSNDQIDDSVSNLEVINSKFSNTPKMLFC